jgi:predicted nuclease of predicted toxin-antitoxin system
MKFLLDDNVPLSVKEWLKKRGIDAIKSIEVGLKGVDDETIYRYAIENDFKIITLDLDFGYLFLKFQKGTVIVLRPRRAIPSEIVKLLERTFDIIKDKDGLIVVKSNKIRVIKPFEE